MEAEVNPKLTEAQYREVSLTRESDVLVAEVPNKSFDSTDVLWTGTPSQCFRPWVSVALS